jgi:hypothetical protein
MVFWLGIWSELGRMSLLLLIALTEVTGNIQLLGGLSLRVQDDEIALVRMNRRMGFTMTVNHSSYL